MIPRGGGPPTTTGLPARLGSFTAAADANMAATSPNRIWRDQRMACSYQVRKIEFQPKFTGILQVICRKNGLQDARNGRRQGRRESKPEAYPSSPAPPELPRQLVSRVGYVEDFDE